MKFNIKKTFIELKAGSLPHKTGKGEVYLYLLPCCIYSYDHLQFAPMKEISVQFIFLRVGFGIKVEWPNVDQVIAIKEDLPY
jgi:hypothetical protein